MAVVLNIGWWWLDFLLGGDFWGNGRKWQCRKHGGKCSRKYQSAEIILSSIVKENIDNKICSISIWVSIFPLTIQGSKPSYFIFGVGKNNVLDVSPYRLFPIFWERCGRQKAESLKGTFFPGFLYFRIWTSLCEWFHLRGQGRERKDKGWRWRKFGLGTHSLNWKSLMGSPSLPQQYCLKWMQEKQWEKKVDLARLPFQHTLIPTISWCRNG